MALSLPIQSMQAVTASEQGAAADLRAQLNAGQTLNGTVREVTADPSRSSQFRVKVEMQNQLMELITSRPLSTGSQISLNRGVDGGLQLTLNAAPQNRSGSEQPGRSPVSAATGEGRAAATLTLQIPGDKTRTAQLAQTLPLNQPQAGRVLPGQNALSSVQIAVNGQTLELNAPRPLQAGLAVTLTRTDPTQVQLQVQPAPINPASQPQLQEGLQQILRDALPQQLPMGEALNQLRQLGNGSRQGDAVGQVVRSMLSLFSVPPRADASSTRQAVQNQLQASGMLPGATHGNSPTQAALQEPLARLAQLAEQLPTEGRERLESLLQGLRARSAVNQSMSLQRWQDQPDGGIERQYRLDLPILLEDERLENTEIRINQQRHRNAQDQLVSQWSIALHFDMEALGTIDARISLQQEWQLSARFWAQQEETLQQIRDQLPALAAQLRSSGFQVEDLHAQQGSAPRETQPPLNRRLVDLHT